MIFKRYVDIRLHTFLALFLWFSALNVPPLAAQNEIGFVMPKNTNRVELEFEKYNNLIVIPVKINEFLTLKFILDTGAESIILTEKTYSDLLGLHLVRQINIHGPGVMDSIKAYVASDVSLSIGGINGTGFNVLVLEEDYLELNKNLGEEVYGIIGHDLFSRFVVDIDYDESKLMIYRPEAFKPKNYFTEIPMYVDTKPHISAFVKQGNRSDTIKLMVDTGASHAALLDVSATDHLVLPEKLLTTRLGQGLGGEIPGFIGRMDECWIDNFLFEDVLISVPREGAYSNAIKRGSRHGTIGGDLLTRFHAIFDYPHKKLYLARGRYFRDDFDYNMSGMTLIADGEGLDSLKVVDLRESGPAAKAGIQLGDHLIKINGLTLYNSSLSAINIMLRTREGKKIKCIVRRDKKRVKIVFRLERLI